MKKVLAFILALMVLCCFAACGTKKEIETTNTPSTTTTETQEPEETTTEEKEPEVAKTWEKSYYVDEFDEPTDEWYISTSFTGTFSNSATNDSRLSGYVLIDQEDVSFILYEYNSNQVKNVYSDAEEYTLTARLEDGSTQEYTGYIYSEGDRIFVAEEDTAAMLDLLQNAGKIKFYVYETENSVTNYLFQVTSDNLKDLLQ